MHDAIAVTETTSTPPRRSVLAHAEVWIFLAVLIAGAYFCGSGSWNQNARLDAIFTFVEPGPHQWTFRIDPFLPYPKKSFNTGDWSLVGGHYYANKAPGTLLLGVLAYLPLHRLEVAAGLDIADKTIEILAAYWINVWVSVVPLAIATVLWYRLMARRLSERRAAAIALFTFFGTALFPYSTQLWGHTTAAAFVMMAWWSFERRPRELSGRQEVLTGVFAGLAVLSDFLALPTVLALLVLTAWRRRERLLSLTLGGAGPLAALLAYQWYCFGNPWALPTEGTRSQFLDATRTLGVFGLPSPRALFELTLGSYRGIFFQMPLAIGALAGYVCWWRREPRAPLLWGSAAAFALSLAIAASFNGWHGGATVCARYLIPALPLLLRALAELPVGRGGTFALWGLGVASTCNMLAVAAVSPLAPDTLQNPLFASVYPQLLAGRLHPYAFPIRLQALHPNFAEWQHITVWNFGDICGLAGLSRLLPLGVLLAALAFGVRRCTSDRRQSTILRGEQPSSSVRSPAPRDSQAFGQN